MGVPDLLLPCGAKVCAAPWYDGTVWHTNCVWQSGTRPLVLHAVACHGPTAEGPASGNQHMHSLQVDLNRVQGHLEAAIESNYLLAAELEAARAKVSCEAFAACNTLGVISTTPACCVRCVLARERLAYACHSMFAQCGTSHVQAAGACCGVP